MEALLDVGEGVPRPGSEAVNLNESTKTLPASGRSLLATDQGGRGDDAPEDFGIFSHLPAEVSTVSVLLQVEV